MSYSFDYATPPTLGPNNLGYLYPPLPIPTTYDVSIDNNPLFANVLAGTYIFTCNVNVTLTSYPVVGSLPYQWSYQLYTSDYVTMLAYGNSYGFLSYVPGGLYTMVANITFSCAIKISSYQTNLILQRNSNNGTGVDFSSSDNGTYTLCRIA